MQLFHSLAPSRKSWITTSVTFFFSVILLCALTVMLFNRGIANHMLWPIFQHIELFQLLFVDNPAAALQFILTKSVFVIAHKDPRSSLNLWTVEFDTLTLLVYLLLSLMLGWVIIRIQKLDTWNMKLTLLFSLAGALLGYVSVSYMTAIDHCAGPTWVGFVAMYGVGFDEFELYPIYQWVFAIAGFSMLLISLIKIQYIRSSNHP